MKELHNHIFSNTTCISKEIMLRYINKQLSKNELYEVEKHMLDCELCSDAYEGMKFAQDSSVLFAIDNQIDQRVASGNSKAPIMRNLMVAASILVIVFGAYFTFNYFNTTVNEGKNLALKNIDEDYQPVEEGMIIEDEELNKQENTAIEKSKEGDKLDAHYNEHEGYGVVVDVPSVPNAEQTPEIADVISYDMEDSIDEVVAFEEETEEVVSVSGNISNTERNNNTVEKASKYGEVVDDEKGFSIDNRREDDFKTTMQSETVTMSSEDAMSLKDNSGALIKEEKKSKSRSKGNKKRNAKTEAMAPSYYADGMLEESKEYGDRKKKKTVVIDSYKVVDYTVEYQKEYDLKTSNTITTKSVSAGFESKADKDEAEKEKEESTIEVTYKQTLEKAIKLYKDKNYTDALIQFNLILKEHPDEVNGLFYGGMSNYQLQRYEKAKGKFDEVLINEQTEFNEEAMWYKALTLIELKKKDAAKKLLQKIINSNGFYKTKAKERLKTL